MNNSVNTSASPGMVQACKRGAYFYAFITLGCCIIIINSLVAVLICRTRLLRKCASNCILLSLSMIDCLTGIVAILITVLELYKTTDCKLTSTSFHIGLFSYYLGKFSMLNSVAHLTLLCCERTISIFYPLRHRTHVTKQRTFKLIACLWIMCGLLTLSEYLLYKNDGSNKERRNLEIIIFVIFASLPTIFLMITYTAILSIIYKYHKNNSTRRRKSFVKKQKAILIYLVMFISFLMLTYPFFVIRLYMFYNGIGPLRKYLSMLAILRVVPSLLNPFIYALFKDDFHRALRRLNTTLKSDNSLTRGDTILSRLSSRFPSRNSFSIRRRRNGSPDEKKQFNEEKDNVFV